MKTLPLTQAWILTYIFISKASAFNTPPAISFSRDWKLSEDEPIGAPVAKIEVHDPDGDNVTIRIGSPTSKSFHEEQLDGSSFFRIDDRRWVRLAKNLTGMAGTEFLVGIIANDGHLRHRVDARVSIQEPNASFKFTPIGLPSNFDPGPPPSHEQLHDSAFSRDSGPPLLHLDPFTKWKVPSDAEVGSHVATVEANDLSETFMRFSISPHTLLNIDPITGDVTVAAPLRAKVGDHQIEVKVSNKHNAITDTVTLRVISAAEEGVSYNTNTPPSSTHHSETAEEPAPTITIIENGLPEDVKASDEKAIGSSVVVLILVLGVFPFMLIVGVVVCVWRSKKKRRASAKESSVSYSEKRGSITAIGSGHRDSIIDGLFSMVGIHKRSESNDYDEDIRAPKVPNRESSKKSTKSNNSNKEKDSWEYSRHKLKFLGILGEGCFGQVWKFEASDLIEGSPNLVAVKTLKESAGAAEQKDLLQELKVLKGLAHHPNVVSLLGCCTEKEPVFVILEYMIGGKLQSYLRSSRAGHSYDNLHGISASLTPRDLTIFALQVARGMDFLSKNGIIHRDLAARNILIGENKVCKVADFGFARDVANNHVYERKSDGRLPIRWMAPESLFDNIFTSKSDVWSFGILLWEIVTLGSTPYPGMSAADVMRKVKDGYRLEKPDHCRREIYNIMYYCWDCDQKQRPSFSELVHTLESLIMTEVEYIHLDNFPDHTYYKFNSVSSSGELL